MHISLVMDKAFILFIFCLCLRAFSCSYSFFTFSSIGNARSSNMPMIKTLEKKSCFNAKVDFREKN